MGFRPNRLYRPGEKAVRIETAQAAKVRQGQSKAAERAHLFVAFCPAHKIPIPQREYAFWPGRRFRFDFAWPEHRVALESEGGAWTNGAHTRGKHFRQDCRKYSEAAVLGWCVIRVLSQDLNEPETFELIQRALEARKAAA